jgi:hypothetical protein
MSRSGSAQSAAVTRVATSTTSATIVAGGGRGTRYIYNDSAGNLYTLLGTGTASATNFTHKLATNSGVHVEGFGGPIQGVLDAGTGNAQVTEW